MRDGNKAILLMLGCSALTVIGQLFFKQATIKLTFTLQGVLLNSYLYFGVLAYALGLIIMLKAYQLGDVTTLYPIIASSYVFVTLIAPLLFPDEMASYYNIAGVMLICIGIVVIGRGSK